MGAGRADLLDALGVPCPKRFSFTPLDFTNEQRYVAGHAPVIGQSFGMFLLYGEMECKASYPNCAIDSFLDISMLITPFRDVKTL